MSYKKPRSAQKDGSNKASRIKPIGCLDQTTNQRLNSLYQKFISKHRDSQPILKNKLSDESSNIISEQSPSPIDQDVFFNKCQISIDKDLSVQRMKSKFQQIVEFALENFDAATTQYLKFIYDKFSAEVERLKYVQVLTRQIQVKLSTFQMKTQQSDLLKQLNRQLQSKIFSLQTQISTLKANKQLSGLRSTLQRVRQSNSIRERNPTPGRDSRFDIQKKLLIKQNLELKKELQNTKKQYELRMQQIISLKGIQLEQDQLLDQNKQNKAQIYQLQNRIQTLQFELQRKTKHIFELQQQIKTITTEPKQQQGFRMKYEVIKVELQAKSSTWNKKLQNKQNELNQYRNKILTLQQETQSLKKTIIKKEVQQGHNFKQMQSLKSQLAFSKQRQYEKRQQIIVKQQHKDVEFDELKTQNQKLKQENIKLLSNLSIRDSKVGQSEGLKTENNLLKQMLKSQKQKSIPKSSIIEAVKKVINMEPPKLKQSQSLNTLLTELYEQMQKSKQQMLEHQLEFKQLRLHKNQIDHILHQQQQGNDFQTTQIDAHFYRTRPTTDNTIKQELKKLAVKLDYELKCNIDANNQIKVIKKRVKILQDSELKICQHLKSIVDQDLNIDTQKQHLTGLLQWTGLEQLTPIYKDKLFS